MEVTTVQILIEELEAEINNGGFDQFFFNSTGNRTAETIEALKAIRAFKTAEIVTRAASKFPGGMPPTEWFERQNILEQVSPESDAFENEDKAFYEYQDDLANLLATYAG
jgi:hypothetical protein